MAYYNNKKSARFELKDFLEMRKNPQCYFVFYTHFIKCITKKTRFEERVKALNAGQQELCTVSDEAFALLLLENSWDRWCDMYGKDPTLLLPRRGGKNQDKSVVSLVTTMYTTGGYRYAVHAANMVKAKKGWSQDGIRRYNQLFDMVESDRAAHPEFVGYLTYYLVGDGTNKGPKKPVSPKEPPVRVRHNLFRTSTAMGIGHDLPSPSHFNEAVFRSRQLQSSNPLTAESDEEEEDEYALDVVKSAGV